MPFDAFVNRLEQDVRLTEDAVVRPAEFGRKHAVEAPAACGTAAAEALALIMEIAAVTCPLVVAHPARPAPLRSFADITARAPAGMLLPSLSTRCRAHSSPL
jgi:hypothetical protein